MRRLALAAVLLIAASLRLWRLDQNGFGTEYYTAGVRSMSSSASASPTGTMRLYELYDLRR